MRTMMFNDRFSLTEAVLSRRKTQTRRIVSEKLEKRYFEEALCAQSRGDKFPSFVDWLYDNSTAYHVGEIVAVAQNLKDMGYDPREVRGCHIWGLDHTAAWTNKMFVCAADCIHQIRITDIRVERLQDIQPQDCLKEGVIKVVSSFDIDMFAPYKGCKEKELQYSVVDAFASLIDKVSGKGTWKSNPYVMVYDFELVK